MTTVITHNRRKSALAQMIDSAGGVSIGVALARAKANLEALRPRSLTEVADRIAELVAIQPPASPEEAPARLAEAYRAASGVIDAAGPFDLVDLCMVAMGLCDLIDAASDERPFDWRVPPVYARSMRLLLALPADATAERAQVRASLDDMVSRKLSQTG